MEDLMDSAAWSTVFGVLFILSIMGTFVCVMRMTLLIEKWYLSHIYGSKKTAEESAKAAIVLAKTLQLSTEADKMLLVVVDRTGEAAKSDEEALRLLRELVNREQA